MTSVRVHRLGVDTPASVATTVQVYRLGVLAPTVTTQIRVYRQGVFGPNVPPYAGPDQANIEPFSLVQLSATDPDSIPYWTQAGGPTVELSGTGSPANRTFTALGTIDGVTLTFAAYDELNNDSMTVTVYPQNEWVMVAGTLTPLRITTKQTAYTPSALDAGTYDSAVYG